MEKGLYDEYLLCAFEDACLMFQDTAAILKSGNKLKAHFKMKMNKKSVEFIIGQ